MGVTEPDGGCRKHPNQTQHPGICSACLRERLCHLSGPSSQNRAGMSIYFSSSLSSSPPYSTDTPSNLDSPRHRCHQHHLRNVMEADEAIKNLTLSCGDNALRRSRSVAFAPRYAVGDDNDGGGKKKKKGFWSKLFRSTGKMTKEVLTHSKTQRERFE